MKNPFPLTDQSWTLFLDRDGVINERLPGRYVANWNEFCFCKGVVNSLPVLNQYFGRVFIVTNQQGIGKGLMTVADLEQVHRKMLDAFREIGGKIDQIYFCPELATNNPHCRKPNPGMALAAQEEFSGIEFDKSIIVGDSFSDMMFGIRLKMKTVLITSNEDETQKALKLPPDLIFPDLKSFADFLDNR